MIAKEIKIIETGEVYHCVISNNKVLQLKRLPYIRKTLPELNKGGILNYFNQRKDDIEAKDICKKEYFESVIKI